MAGRPAAAFHRPSPGSHRLGRSSAGYVSALARDDASTSQGLLSRPLGPAFAFKTGDPELGSLLKGRSARIVITTGMPALITAGLLRARPQVLERSILRFVGRPDRHDRSLSEAQRRLWLDKLRALARRGA